MATKQKPSETIIFDNTSDTPKPVITKQHNGSYKQQFEKNNGVSTTVPDQSMTVKEMLARTQRGLPISSGAMPIYNGERLLPNWKSLDLIDRQRVVQEAQKNVDAKKRRWEKQKQEVDQKLAALAKQKADDLAKQQAQNPVIIQDDSKK